MAKVHGISGSTRYLLKGTKAINGKKLATLEDIDLFHHNYEAIMKYCSLTSCKKKSRFVL